MALLFLIPGWCWAREHRVFLQQLVVYNNTVFPKVFPTLLFATFWLATYPNQSKPSRLLAKFSFQQDTRLLQNASLRQYVNVA